MKLSLRCVIAFLAICMFPIAGFAGEHTITLDITAYIDGRDQLIIQGGTLQWHHFDFAAVGRWGGANVPTTISTTLDGAPVLTKFNWTPDWPLPPPNEIRFEAFSSIFSGLDPSLPDSSMTVTLTPIQARDSVSIVQSPSASNGQTLIVEFNDDPSGGPAFYEVLLTIETSSSLAADLFLRIRPTLTTVHQGDLLTYAFPVWNLGPSNAYYEVLNTQVPEGTVFDYIRISGTPGLGTCTHTPYLGAGPIPIVCHENSAMALNTTWTVRLTVKVTASAGTVITENAAVTGDNPDPNMANNTATVSLTVVP
jgi:Domain of unknown function DUF11